MLTSTLLFGLVYLTSSVTAVIPKSQPCLYPSLINATSDQLQDDLVQECFSSVDLVNAYIGRIDDVNSTLHAVIELNPDALEIAKQLDLERKQGIVRGQLFSPLHGLPILIKANIGTADKLNTTSGSYALLGARLSHDSTIVAKLREAGMIVLGMAGLSEWAFFRSANSTNGWSAYGGQVFAAYHPQQDPSGSSSGSGVSADLGLAFAALGTETGGSIVAPSENSNVIGLKPTVGLTSRHLVVPISQHQDSVGPMTRTVKDAAKLLQTIAGPDPNDNYTSANPFGSDLPDYASACDPAALKGKRIGIPRNVLEAHLDVDSTPIRYAFDAAVSVIAECGATLIDNANFTALDQFLTSPTPLDMMSADFVSDLAFYLSQLKTNPNDLDTLEELRNFTQGFPLESYPDRDTELWDNAIAAGINNSSPEFWPMYQNNLYMGGEGGVLGALARYDLDAIILPTSFSPDFPALVGSPVISVPMGVWPEDTEVEYEPRGELVRRGPGFPIGLSFLGGLWCEESLIGTAYAYEQASMERGKLRRYVQPKTELEDVK